MYNNNRQKKNPNHMVIPAHLRISTGHREHGSGSGTHKDKRTRRNRTRSNQSRNHIGEW